MAGLQEGRDVNPRVVRVQYPVGSCIGVVDSYGCGRNYRSRRIGDGAGYFPRAGGLGKASPAVSSNRASELVVDCNLTPP